MPLTQDQQTFITGFEAASVAFVAALTASLEADNAPTATTLGDAATLRSALDLAGRDLSAALGHNSASPLAMQLISGPYLQRTRPGEDPYVSPGSIQRKLPR